MNNEEIQAFLQRPIIADMATVRSDGSPHVAPVWYLWNGETVKVMSEPTAVKVRNIRHDPRVSLSIATNREPYEYAIVKGTAALSEIGAPEVRELLWEISIHYRGQEAGERYAEQTFKEISFVILTVTPEKISGWSQ